MTGTVVRGIVRTRSGEPVLEARIYVTKAPVPMPDVAALSNEEGRFALHLPAAGSYTLQCTADGYLQSTRTLVVSAAEQRPEVEIAFDLETESSGD